MTLVIYSYIGTDVSGGIIGGVVWEVCCDPVTSLAVRSCRQLHSVIIKLSQSLQPVRRRHHHHHYHQVIDSSPERFCWQASRTSSFLCSLDLRRSIALWMVMSPDEYRTNIRGGHSMTSTRPTHNTINCMGYTSSYVVNSTSTENPRKLFSQHFCCSRKRVPMATNTGYERCCFCCYQIFHSLSLCCFSTDHNEIFHTY